MCEICIVPVPKLVVTVNHIVWQTSIENKLHYKHVRGYCSRSEILSVIGVIVT